MYFKLITVATLVTMATSVMGADPCFPSPVSPKGNNDITQLISIIWDDNAYSGKKGTTYETQEYIDAVESGAGDAWQKIGRVDGVMFTENSYGTGPIWKSESFGDTPTPIPNPGNYTEGDFGMSWATKTLATGDMKFTFNPITGQMSPIYGPWVAPEEANAQSRLGWKGYSYETIDWNSPDQKSTWAPVCWGREYEVVVPMWQSGTTADQLLKDPTAGVRDQPNWAQEMYQEAIDEGHEIGNHTIDHMESNSGLPKEEWPNNGDGWDDDLNEGEDNPYWEKYGWLEYAGQKIEQKTWFDAIKLGEAELTEYLTVNGQPISVANNNLFSFRAPRLEVNSNLYLALQEAGYLYDCGLEENYEAHQDGSNALFPYTLDNGVKNTWYQKNIGEKQYLDEMPQVKNGDPLWQIPCNAFIVPENIRDDVWKNHKKIVLAEIENGNAVAADTMSLVEWKSSGAKVTSFDFNMFILWGMTKSQFVETMMYNLNKRIDGNRAPFHFGAHTEYYSPMYDLGPLRTDAAYGVCLEFNKWEDRQEGLEEFRDKALNAGAKFVSGKTVIDSMKAWMGDAPKVGTERIFDENVVWEFMSDNKSSSTKENFTADGTNGDITVTVSAPADGAWAQFGAYGNAPCFKSLSHIKLDYKTTSALSLNIEMNNAKIYSVLLNNIGVDVNSGMIPISAFEDTETEGLSPEINTEEIVGISISPLAPFNIDDGTYSERTEPYDVTFSVKNLRIYGDEIDFTVTPNTVVNSIPVIKNSVMSISTKALTLNIANAGNYDISVVSTNGRTVRQLKNTSLKTGVNKLSLNNLAKGLYVVRVKCTNNRMSFTRSMMAMK